MKSTKKYGLIKPPNKKPLLEFNYGDEDGDKIPLKDEVRNVKKKEEISFKAKTLQKEALEEDPSIFEYDAVIDKIKEEEKNEITKKFGGESKYVLLMKETAMARKQEANKRKVDTETKFFSESYRKEKDLPSNLQYPTKSPEPKIGEIKEKTVVEKMLESQQTPPKEEKKVKTIVDRKLMIEEARKRYFLRKEEKNKK